MKFFSCYFLQKKSAEKIPQNKNTINELKKLLNNIGIKEKDIISWVKYTEMNFIDCACKVTKKNLGKRKEVKALSYQLTDMYEHADTNILNSMFHVNPNTTFTDKS